MQITAHELANAPLVRLPLAGRPVQRRSIGELLDDARIDFPVWYAKLDDSRLHIAAAADFNEVVELIATAPCERLAGYVEGLYVNN
jgi:hypothetical protein